MRLGSVQHKHKLRWVRGPANRQISYIRPVLRRREAPSARESCFLLAKLDMRNYLLREVLGQVGYDVVHPTKKGPSRWLWARLLAA